MNQASLRQEIDNIDREILRLLNRRFEFAVQVRKLKQVTTVLSREEEVLQGVRNGSRNLLDPDFVERLFQAVIEQSKVLQNRELPLLGFQGEHGAYSEVAATTFRSEGVAIPFPDFQSVVDGVRSSVIDYGVLPVENSVAGPVGGVLDILASNDFDLTVICELFVPIHHCMLARRGVDPNSLREVYSHQQALSQCREYLSGKGIEARPAYDTAGAAKMLADGRLMGVGVIASRLCAELYDLQIVEENIEDNPHNTTRFLVVTKQAHQVAAANKCSIVFSLTDSPGALSEAIQILASGGINLTRIESRPVPHVPGEFAFLVDFTGALESEATKSAMEKLEKSTLRYRVLGCYEMAQ